MGSILSVSNVGIKLAKNRSIDIEIIADYISILDITLIKGND